MMTRRRTARRRRIRRNDGISRVLMVMMPMIPAGGRAVLIFVRGRLFQREILARQAACETSIKSSVSLALEHTTCTPYIFRYVSYIRGGRTCICTGSQQEETCDTGVTLSLRGSIFCLHPAARCYFLSYA